MVLNLQALCILLILLSPSLEALESFPASVGQDPDDPAVPAPLREALKVCASSCPLLVVLLLKWQAAMSSALAEHFSACCIFVSWAPLEELHSRACLERSVVYKKN